MKYRVLPPQFELMDSKRLCIFQLLDILHLLFVAPELLSDQDLHTPADNMINYNNIIIYNNKNNGWGLQNQPSPEEHIKHVLCKNGRHRKCLFSATRCTDKEESSLNEPYKLGSANVCVCACTQIREIWFHVQFRSQWQISLPKQCPRTGDTWMTPSVKAHSHSQEWA